ncbi:hypothetical protein B0G69_8081 [Paraburkholderia sp. RAU2J]|uniref:CAP domain-containing protein n=1 Tax=Paraburkholderia sp. RAU2J TaxID=1938810 RepID=UPI000EAEE397|nr:CAP domain-containing protein [Paraburkholderia sp. RAU2J]RKT10647.1 hypothetical protein B0G69_8081 [Paraburkholderia sp. RAU2J]
MNKTFKLTAVSFAAAIALSACGGGGGGSSSSGAAAPASGASAPTTSPAGATTPQTSVPAPTYSASTMQQATFAQLNAYRLAMGVGELAQDPILDTSAQAHALYLDSNLASGKLTALAHNEDSSFANYYGDTPLSRAQKAGAPVTEWIGEVVAAGLPQTSGTAYGTDCLRQYLNTVYHLQSVTANQQSIGIGFQQSFGSYPIYSCVLDFGQTSGVSGTPMTNGLNVAAGQILPVGSIAHSPLSNETGVALAMVAEAPNPAPDLTAPGRPIMVRVNAANQGDVLTVTSFTLTSSSGTAVPARVIVPSAALTGSTGATADVNNAFFPGVVVLLPLAPLAANTTYNVSFSGSRDGTPLNNNQPLTWTFTTGN